MRTLSDLAGTLLTAFKIKLASISSAGLTAARTFTLPDLSGTIALEPTAWTSWTPSIRNFTIGNGSIQGWYSKNGKTVDFRILLTVGSTSSLVSTTEIQLPFTSASRPNFAKMADGLLNTNGAELIPIALLQISSDSWCRVVYLKSIAASAETNYVAPASIFYVNGFTYEFTGSYEIQ